MKGLLISSFTIILFFTSCIQQQKEVKNRQTSSTNTKSELTKDTTSKSSNTLRSTLGNRFTIEGDFDGDGKTEKLTEYYINQIDEKEINKNYDNRLEYDDIVTELISKKQPKSFCLSDNKNFDTLNISSTPNFGIYFLKNEGNLNNAIGDEISYVVDWADWSNLNTFHIVTLKNNKWVEIASFPIWEWQLSELKEGESLVKCIENGKVECYYRNDYAMLDTMHLNFSDTTSKIIE